MSNIINLKENSFFKEKPYYVGYYYIGSKSCLVAYPHSMIDNKRLQKLFRFDDYLSLTEFFGYLNKETNKKIKFYNNPSNLSENSIKNSDISFFEEIDKKEGEEIHDLILSVSSSWRVKFKKKINTYIHTTKRKKKESLNDNWRKIKGLNYIYIICKKLNWDKIPKNNERIKIGITNDLNKRLYDYNTHSVDEVEVIRAYPIIDPSNSDAENIERRIKHECRFLNIHQEWFYARRNDITSIVENQIYESEKAKFRVTQYTDRYGQRFFIEYPISLKNDRELLMIEYFGKTKNIYLMKKATTSSTIHFKNDKLKKIRSFKIWNNMLIFIYDYINEKQKNFLNKENFDGYYFR